MRQLVLEAPYKLTWREAPLPKPKTAEALVKVHWVGVCGSDVHAYRGHQPFLSYPRVLGHELGLEVVEVAADNERGLRPGDRATLEPVVSCGQCYPCRHGHPNACEKIQVLGVHADGGLQEYMTLPVKLLHKSEILDYEALALVEPACIGAQAVNRGRVGPGDFVVVIGSGTIGTAVMQRARAKGATVTSGDILAWKLELARKLGADHVIDMNDVPRAVKEVRQLTSGAGASVVVEAVGLTETIESTVEYVASGGRVVILGVGDQNVTFAQKVFVAKELDFLGSRNSYRVFPEVIRLCEAGQVRMKEFVSHRFAFDEAIHAFDFIENHRPEVSKAVIKVAAD